MPDEPYLDRTMHTHTHTRRKKNVKTLVREEANSLYVTVRTQKKINQ